MIKEFKEFAIKGNMIDLAIGVIIGGAFGKIVTSLVNDIIMPLIGMLLGKVDFTNLFIVLGKVPEGTEILTLEAAKESGIATLNYGLFINNIIDFLIVAFSIFLVVRQINRFAKKKEVEPEVVTKQCKYCYSEIHKDATRCPLCTSQVE